MPRLGRLSGNSGLGSQYAYFVVVQIPSGLLRVGRELGRVGERRGRVDDVPVRGEVVAAPVPETAAGARCVVWGRSRSRGGEN